MRKKSLVMVAALVIVLSCACYAQNYEDWSVAQTSPKRAFSMGVQLGMPYVLGVDVASHFTSRMSVGLGLGYVPDLITIGGQFRLNLMEPGPDKTIPVVGAGINQYWIEDADRNIEPVAIDVLAGVDHFFGSNMSLGMYVGYLKSLTETEVHNVKVWGINNNVSKLFLGITGRYYF